VKKIKILIVEDEVMIAQCLKMDFEEEGFDVCGFTASGEESVVEAKENNPDLILMDIHLQGRIDGIEAAEKINENNSIPIFFMTGYDKSNIIERARKVNPVAVLTKPVSAIDLRPMIESILK